MENDIRDIKGVLELPWDGRGLMGLFAILAVALLAGLFAYLIYRRQRQQRMPPTAPLIPSDLEALIQLDRLKQERLPETGKVKEYFFRLSAIVRRYLERRFGVPASEQTTEEFLAAIEQSEFLNQEQKKTMREFMLRSDLIKFAKHEASLADCNIADQVARKLIEETKEKITIAV